MHLHRRRASHDPPRLRLLGRADAQRRAQGEAGLSAALLRATIAASVALYAASEYFWFRDGARRFALRGALWTAAAILCAMHAALAFHVHHGWSQAAAVEHTAAQTAAVTGLAWGGGLYVNYAFITLWLLDAAWVWSSRATYLRRGPVVDRAISAWFLFIVFNGAVVFARGPARVLGIAAVALVAWAWWRGPRRAADKVFAG